MSESALNETIMPAQHVEPEVGQGVSALGTQLATEREAKGWSIEQVATQLNLAPRQIQALERDDYAALPGMASVRGFIRAYAKLLKLDATPLIAMISPKTVVPNEAAVPRRAFLAAPFSENRSLSSRRRGLPFKLSIVALGLFVLLIIVYAGEQVGLPPGVQKQITAVLKIWGVLPATEPVVSPIAGAAQNNTASAIVHDASAVVPTPVAPMPVVAPIAVASVPEAAPATMSGEKLRPTSGGLVLKLREDSWVEIKRANNSVLISRLVKAGSTESFEITEPVSLTLGNAAGVDLNLRGAPVDLKPGTKNNITRMNLR